MSTSACGSCERRQKTASRIDFCRTVELRISRIGRKISFRRTSISFLSLVRIPLSTRQKISQLSSKTWITGETALRERARQRYCLTAWMNGVRSREVDEWITTFESTNIGRWLFRIESTRCKERSLERIACDFRSRSLSVGLYQRFALAFVTGTLTSRRRGASWRACRELGRQGRRP